MLGVLVLFEPRMQMVKGTASRRNISFYGKMEGDLYVVVCHSGAFARSRHDSS
jgi:hypothetical protein